MKLRISNFRQAGNTLFVTVLLIGLISFVLAAYLTLVRSQNHSNVRSQAWNSTMPIIEAGVEEALSHLNAHGLTNLLCDDWTIAGDKFTLTRKVGDAYYLLTITNWVGGGSNCAPIVESRGFARMPYLAASSENTLMAQAGGGTYAGVSYIGRGVRVATTPNNLFVKGMVAKDSMDLNGNSIETDSFDSENPLYSTNGQYNLQLRRENGDIATNSSLTNSVRVGSANILGHVSTGPSGTIAVGNDGTVGSQAWHTAGHNGIEPGWSSDSMNVSFPSVSSPFGGGYTPSGGYVTNGSNVVYYNYILEDGDYQLTSLNGSVYVKGDARLTVSSDFDLSGLTIQSGNNLKLYCAASSANFALDTPANGDGNAVSFQYYGLPSNANISFSGGASFTGTIYAPEAAFVLNNSALNHMEFFGAAITRTVTLNGDFRLHYDEALARNGPFRGWVVNSWIEMTSAEVASAPY